MSHRRVLIVDDSLTIRAIISELCASHKELKVVGYAKSGEEALDAIEQLQPDVLTLDIALPGMDGLTFLMQVMRDHPMPVVVVSAAGKPKSPVCERAMALGAAACFDKADIVSDARTLLRAIAGAKRGQVR